MARVPAFVDERFRPLMSEANLNKLFVAVVRFAEVGAESALTVVHFHDFRPDWFIDVSRKRETIRTTDGHGSDATWQASRTGDLVD